MSNNKLPEPDMGAVDPNAVLRSRIDVGSNHTQSIPAHTQVRTGKGRQGSRPDPEGMRRYSLYVTAEAAEALDEAVTTVRQALGADTPRHVALSALLHAAAEQADTVASRLAKQRAHELTEQLEHLQSTAPDG